MRVQSPPSAAKGGYQDAESLFRSRPISEIRNVEATTRKQIEDKKEELRQLVGNRYRDLIDSADSIVLMKSSCESISSNISSIQASIRSLSETPKSQNPSAQVNPARFTIYGIACRVKYLVDTPENIWGCLDESMFLEAAARYSRARHVHHRLLLDYGGSGDPKILSRFPLLQHQWQIVESFKAQISQRSRDRLLDSGGLKVGAYADALAAVAVIDDLQPRQVLALFLDSRKSWILQKLGAGFVNPTCTDVVSVFCQVLRAIQVTMGQVGELFLQVLNDMPLFYKVILSSPPASQLFGGIPNPDEEVRLWKSFRDKLENSMMPLDKAYIAKTCLTWLKECRQEIVNRMNGQYLTGAISNGKEIALAEKLIRETMDSKEVLEGSLEWLKSVFGSEIELPWSRIRELVLEDDLDLWDEIFDDAFVQRMKTIIQSGFGTLARDLHVVESIRAIDSSSGEQIDFRAYLSRPSTGGGVWFIESNDKKAAIFPTSKPTAEESNFQSCLTAYFGPEVNRIRDAVENCCRSVLEDLLSFLESPKAAARLKKLAQYIQEKCYDCLSGILSELKSELDDLSTSMRKVNGEDQSMPAAIIVERSLFIGRLLFALQHHSRHIPIVLGSPRFWVNDSVASVFDKLPSLLRLSGAVADSPISDSPIKQTPLGSKRHTSLATAALLGAEDIASPKLKDFTSTTRDLCVRAHSLWISWLSDELSAILSRDLNQDDGLSATTALRGWEDTVIKQEQSEDGEPELKISLPSMPSLYVISFLFRACEEIHRIGGHVLDKLILQKFALQLLERVLDMYGNYLSTREATGSEVSDKGALQIMLDVRFVYDILSGGNSNVNEDLPKSSKPKFSFRQKLDQKRSATGIGTRVDGLLNRLSQRLDPIDWQTYEPHLWENERQSYLRHAVLFGFFVQLNRMYKDTVQKLPTNSESNIMRCSTVPRFKYLPISAPALSSRGAAKTSIPVSVDDLTSRTRLKAYANGELSGNLNLSDSTSSGMAAPLLKSFMQVGSRFGESTLKLGSILTDGQVGIFKDRSAAALSTFSDVLPVQAAGLLSSFTATRTDS
ncbi:conserved oligomeric Golgi complex subunit 1 [Punica granatum]|uniref:Conserved oligomeric Golgi complex subunit 1 n=2 Tax=Punica granatum TaxID=22663 RepID=A0A218XSZ5_PUNGR|nr:conserved oligomeric Golgi complex subunit 1 [Punica granatum]OWM87739.1 hypothetical protein CDL15_Pgr016435 [Punica granatum]PKI63356.1 hypothetical protein CRG98_016244 [Punica granatum]